MPLTPAMAKSNRTTPNALNLTDHERQEIDHFLSAGKPSLPPQTIEQAAESRNKGALQAQIILVRPASEPQSRNWYNGPIQRLHPAMPPPNPP